MKIKSNSIYIKSMSTVSGEPDKYVVGLVPLVPTRGMDIYVLDINEINAMIPDTLDVTQLSGLLPLEGVELRILTDSLSLIYIPGWGSFQMSTDDVLYTGTCTIWDLRATLSSTPEVVKAVASTADCVWVNWIRPYDTTDLWQISFDGSTMDTSPVLVKLSDLIRVMPTNPWIKSELLERVAKRHEQESQALVTSVEDLGDTHTLLSCPFVGWTIMPRNEYLSYLHSLEE